MAVNQTPPICDYEGSDYQTSFWDTGGREYEDRCEAFALKNLLPKSGRLLLELGAGAGRNTLRYPGFEQIVLLDYSRTQLQRAQERLGMSKRYIFVAADIYRLPFCDSIFDAATMIRTLHHMADASAALQQVRNVLCPDATLILEFANKLNLKAILRYAFHRQAWNPFSPESIEFAPLNFDFHPRTVRGWLNDLDFYEQKILAVSHFRVRMLKQIIPARVLARIDSLLQWTGSLWQLTPSVFVKAKLPGYPTKSWKANERSIFKCPDCGNTSLVEQKERISCSNCKHTWKIVKGIYDFRGEEA